MLSGFLFKPNQDGNLLWFDSWECCSCSWSYSKECQVSSVFDGKITVSLVFSFYSAVVNLLKSIQLHFMQIQILSIWKSCTYFLFSS